MRFVWKLFIGVFIGFVRKLFIRVFIEFIWELFIAILEKLFRKFLVGYCFLVVREKKKCCVWKICFFSFVY